MSVYTVRVEHGRRRPEAEIPESGPVTPPYLHHPSEVTYHRVLVDPQHPDGRDKHDHEMDNEARNIAYDMASATKGRMHDNDMVTKSEIISLEAVLARSTPRFEHFVLPEDPYDAHALLTMAASHHTAAPINPPGVSDFDHNRLHDLVSSGGFTSHPWRDSPSHGFMTSLNTDIAPGAVHHISEITPEHIAAHRESIKGHLLQPGVFQGGWHDRATGDVYLDTSVHSHNEHHAIRAALHHKQKAYYNLGTGEEKYLDPHSDPQKHEDHEGWTKKYNGKTDAHPGYAEYAHLYAKTSSKTAGKHDPWYATASDAEIDAHHSPDLIRSMIGEHTAPNGTKYRLVNHMGRMVTAHQMPSGRRAGGITWFGGKKTEGNSLSGTIHKVVVSGPHRRKGLASAMLNFARQQNPKDDILHSTALTDDGRAWAEKTAHYKDRDRLQQAIDTFDHPVAKAYRSKPDMDGWCHQVASAFTRHAREHGLRAETHHVDDYGHSVTVVHHGGGSHVIDWAARQSDWAHPEGHQSPVPLVHPYVGKASFDGAEHPTRRWDASSGWDDSHDVALPGMEDMRDYPHFRKRAHYKDPDWRPHARIFGPGEKGEDPRLFDGDHLKDGVRDNIIETLDKYWEPKYGHQWVSWAKVYFTGSEASHWYGNNDFDVLIGIDYDEYRKDTGSTLQNEEIDDLLNKGFRADLNGDFDFGGDTYSRTWYVNPGTYDIRVIKPYAAYDVVDDIWVVKPVTVPKDWGPDKFPDSTWHMAEHYADEIDRISHLDPKTRQQYAERLFDHIHTDRQRAFSDRGTGVFDTGNVSEKYLDQRPDHPLALLVEMKNAGASGKGRFGKTASTDGLTFRHHGDEHIGFITAHHPDMPSHDEGGSAGAIPNYAGSIEWERGSGVVRDVHTADAMRRQGIGTALWEEAKKVTPHLKHDTWQTPEGAAWADKTANVSKTDHPLALLVEMKNAGKEEPKPAEHDYDRNQRVAGAVHTSQGRVLPAHRVAVISEPEQEHRLSSQWFPESQSTRFRPVTGLVHGARAYAAMKGLPDPHSEDFHKVVTTPQDVRETGRAYDALPEHDRAAEGSFEAMRHEINHQYDHLTNRMGIKVQSVKHDPYADVHEMAHDIQHNKTLRVLGTATTGSHPLFSDEDNDKFRAVHDAFGHAATGRGFDRHGEQAAYVAHTKLFTPAARGALRTETQGQNASLNLNGVFAPQKIALLPGSYARTASVKEAAADSGANYTYKHVLAQPRFGEHRYGDSMPHPSPEHVYQEGASKAMGGAHIFEHQFHHNGTPVAKLRYSIHPDEPHVLNIEGLAVHPDHQHSGLAFRLSDKMQEHARSIGGQIDHGTYTDQGHAFSRKYMRSDHYDSSLHLPYPEHPTATTGEDFLPHMLDEHEMEKGRKTAYYQGHGGWVQYYDNIAPGWENDDHSSKTASPVIKPIRVFRGIHFGNGTAEDVARMHADPVAYAKEKGVFDRPAGIHWSTSPHVAANFAVHPDNGNENAYDDMDPEQEEHEAEERKAGRIHPHGVVLEGSTNPQHVVHPDRNPEEYQDYANDAGIYSRDHNEQEETVRDNAPVSLHHVHSGHLDEHGNSTWGRGSTSMKTTAMGMNGPDYPRLHFMDDGAEIAAMHPEHGHVGRLEYEHHDEGTKEHPFEHIRIHQLETSPGHQRRGVASALMSELESSNPGVPIDHGMRTKDGAGWAAKQYDHDEDPEHLGEGMFHAGWTKDGKHFDPHMQHTAAIALDCGDCGQRYFTDGEPHGCTQKTADMAGIIGGADDDSCQCCNGTGEHPSGHECHRCDASGQEKGATGSCDARTMSKGARIHRPAEGPDGEAADGIMIALVPPKRVIDRLPIPPGGEHPSNVHITLLYLGKVKKFTKEQVAYLPEVIEAWGETQKALKATVQGVGTFSNPGSHVLWAAADIPGGNHLWVSLANTLKSHGYDFHEDHGWTPHLTMSYEKSHVRFIPKVERMEFSVREVWCCVGGIWESFPLRG